MKSKVSVIIVSWNCWDMLSDCLKSLYESECKDFEVVVVDNASSDKTIENIRALYPDVKLIDAGGNIGFGAACNLGAKKAVGNWFFFLNPDTEAKKNSISTMIKFLDLHPDIAVVGAKLLWPDGTFQDSYKRFFSPFFSVLELFEIHYYFPNNFLNREVNYDFNIFSSPEKVDWVIGAAFVVKRETFERVGGFDEGFFMYFEEIDLCKRVSQKNGDIYFLPECEIIHKKGKVSEKTNVRSVDYYKSMYRYHLKHGFPGAGTLIRISIMIMCLIYLFVLALKLFLKSDKQHTIKKMKNRMKLFLWSIGL